MPLHKRSLLAVPHAAASRCMIAEAVVTNAQAVVTNAEAVVTNAEAVVTNAEAVVIKIETTRSSSSSREVSQVQP